MTGSKGLRIKGRAHDPLSNGTLRSSVSPLVGEKNAIKGSIPHSGRLAFSHSGRRNGTNASDTRHNTLYTLRNTSKRHEGLRMTHTLMHHHASLKLHLCISLTLYTPFHHTNSTIHYHFNLFSFMQFPSITKSENSPSTFYHHHPPSPTFALRIHHFHPIRYYFIHHLITQKYLQFVSTNSTHSTRYHTFHTHFPRFKRYRLLFSTIPSTIFPSIHLNLLYVSHTIHPYIHFKDPSLLPPFFSRETQFIYAHFAIFTSNFPPLYQHQYSSSTTFNDSIALLSPFTIHSIRFEPIGASNSSQTSAPSQHSILFYMHSITQKHPFHPFIHSILPLSNIASLNISLPTLSTSFPSHSIRALRDFQQHFPATITLSLHRNEKRLVEMEVGEEFSHSTQVKDGSRWIGEL